MSISQIFLKRRRSLGGIRLDAVIRESHRNEVQISSEVVENGFVVADNASIMPKEITLLINVSDTPLSFVSATGDIIDQVTGLFGSSSDSNLTRSQSAYVELLRIMENLEVIETVETNLINYQNMMIVSMPVIQDVDTAREITIPVVLREVTFSSSQTFELPEGSRTGETLERTRANTQKGRIESLEPSEGRQTSYLKTVSGWLGLGS